MKMHSKSIFLVIFLLALIPSGIIGYLYFDLQGNFDSLRNRYEILEESLQGLQSRYEALNDTYRSLLAEHQSLKRDYSNLEANYESTSRLYKALSRDYSSLKQQYYSLERYYKTEAMLRIGNSLESYYDHLREKMGPRSWWSRQQEADFAAKLASHALGRNCWPSLENEYYMQVGEHSYELAKERLYSVMDLIAITYSSPTQKIESTLQFIQQNIHYEYEFGDIYLAPAETLGFKSGDCDDFSILAAALFEAAGIDSAFGIFSNSEKEYHCMVLVRLEKLEGYSYWSYSDLTDLGLTQGKWIIIEPQTTIEHQGDDGIGEWNLLAASPVN